MHPAIRVEGVHLVNVAHKACHVGCWWLCAVHFLDWAGLGQAEVKQEGSGSEHFRKRALQKASTSESEHFRKRALQKASTSESEHFRKRALPKASTSESEHFQKQAGSPSRKHMLHIFQRASNSESSCNNIVSKYSVKGC